MKRLTCEMCGSNELVKNEGLFVCQSCGTKYTVEEARKLLVEVDGVVNVQVDRSAEMDNRLQNAVAEYNAGHHERAITLFNDVLNIDYENVAAIIYKAASDGWLSTLNDNHVYGTAQEMCRAIGIAKGKGLDDIALSEAILPALQEITEISSALVSLCKKEFENVKADCNRLIALAEEAKKQAKHYMMVGPVAAAGPYYKQAERYGLQGKELLNDYKTSVKDNQQETSAAMKEVAYAVLDSLSDAEEVCDGFMPAMTEFMSVLVKVDANAGTSSLTLRRAVDEFRSRITISQMLIKSKRIEEYWNEHAEEKQALQAEEAQLKEQKASLEDKHAAVQKTMDGIRAQYEGPVPAEKERDELLQKRSSLREQLGKLGIFKMKEKKLLNAELDQLEPRIAAAEKNAKQERARKDDEVNDLLAPHRQEQKGYDDQIAQVQNRLDEIKDELTRDRR